MKGCKKQDLRVEIIRNCLNFMNDKCDELYLDDFILCDEVHSGVYVTRSIRKKR